MGGWAAVYMSPAARAGGDADVTFVKAIFAYVNFKYYFCNMKKEKIITIRVSEEEYDLIIEKAVKLGLSISAYLRMLGLKE